MLPKQAIIATTTNGAGECGTAGRPSHRRQTAAPRKPPMTMPGPKMPPDPPEPIESDGGQDLREREQQDHPEREGHDGRGHASWTQP